LTRFDALCEQVAATLDVDDVIMDGEVIAADETGRPQFYDLLRCARKPAYVAFDLLWPDGVDLRSLPLSERRRRLQGIISKDSPAIAEVLSVRGRGRQLFELMHSYDLEGIVAKRLMIRTTRSSAGSKAHRAAEAAADLECRFDDGVAREVRRDRFEVRDFAGQAAAGHSVSSSSGQVRGAGWSTYMG